MSEAGRRDGSAGARDPHRTRLLHAADPVLAQLIDDRPDFDPDVWIRRLPAIDLFGALVFQIIGQQISLMAATAIFARLTGHFGGRMLDAGELAVVGQETLRGLGLSRRKAATVLIWRSASAMGACPRPSCVSCSGRGDDDYPGLGHFPDRGQQTTWRLCCEHTSMLVEEVLGGADAGIAEISRAEAEQITAGLAARRWPPDLGCAGWPRPTLRWHRTP